MEQRHVHLESKHNFNLDGNTCNLKNYALLASIEAAIGTDKLESVTNSSFMEMESISIDYGIMEKANSIYTLPGSFGWDDVGSWLAIERMNPQDEDGNVLQGDVIAAGMRNSTVLAGKRLVDSVGRAGSGGGRY